MRPQGDRPGSDGTRSAHREGDVSGAVDVVVRWQQTGAAGSPDEQVVSRLQQAVEHNGVQGYWTWTLDRMEEAENEGRDVPHAALAAAHAGAGDDESALEHLRVALEQAERGLQTLRWDPVWDDLRSDERFQELVREARALRFSPSNRRGPPGRGGRGPGDGR